MNDYIEVEQIAKIWGVSKRQVQILCKEGKVSGAIKFGASWAIPKKAKKPTRTVGCKPRPKTINN